MKNMPMLTPILISMLRREIGYSASCQDFAKCAIEFYDLGKNGKPYEILPCPLQFKEKSWNLIYRFMRLCYDQGREDANEVSA